MKLFAFLSLFLPTVVLPQAKDTASLAVIQPTDSLLMKNLNGKPEILTSGFIDIASNGQVNASARFIRLYIGEPGRLALPLSIYSGVSSNNFQNQQTISGSPSNEQFAGSFINPLCGLINVFINGTVFHPKSVLKITKAGILYHAGERILTGYKSGPSTDPSIGKPINFLNSIGAGGLYFQTGAWEKNDAGNTGISWLALRYIACYSGVKQLKNILPSIQTNGFYAGWSLAWGIEINYLLNMKVVYYKYAKPPPLDISSSLYQFTFNYALKN